MKKYVWPGIALVLAVLLFLSLNIRSEQRALLPEDHPLELAALKREKLPLDLIEFKPTRIGNEPAKSLPDTSAAPDAAGSLNSTKRDVLAEKAVVGGSDFIRQPPSEITQLMTELRETNDAAKKADLTKQLDAAIVAIFDKDMSTRETDLSQLEERLTKLRNQLKRRKEAKSEIIQLQIKLMVNEADGLGFSGTPATNGRQ